MKDLAELYQKFDNDFQKDKPAPIGNGNAIAAIAGSVDLKKEKFIVRRDFKSGGVFYSQGDFFTPADRMQAVKFAQAGHILPEAEWISAQRYEAAKPKHDRVKMMYNELGGMRSAVLQASAQVGRAQAELDSARDAYQYAMTNAEKLESELIKELS